MEKKNERYLSVLNGEQAVWFNVELSDGKIFLKWAKSLGCVWFNVELTDGKIFLKWAKSLGCVWFNGEEIKENEQTKFFTIELKSNGTIGYVPNFCKANEKLKDIKRINFSPNMCLEK